MPNSTSQTNASETRNRPLGAQISHMLKDRGVEVIFGIPGVHNQEMYRGIEEAGLTHILARHEQGAGFMADGYARATGRPGVCYVITGPGLCNIMTPMGQAYSDSVPMLVISSCLDETAALQGQLHQMKDQEIAAGTVCDWSHTAMTATAAYGLVDRALTEFSTLRKRPKHIQVPIRQLEAHAPSFPAKAAPPLDMCASAQQARVLRDKLELASRPLFIFGGGAALQRGQMQPGQAPDWLEAFLNLGAASFTTYAGRGIIPPDHALHFGATLPRAESGDIIGSADLVVAVGTSLAEVDLWRHHLGHRAELVRIDIDPQVLSDVQHAEIKLRVDAHSLLCDTFKTPIAPKTSWSAKEVTAAEARWRAQSDAERPGIVPLCDALRAATPQDTMFYSDMTQFAYVAKEVFAMDRPGHWHHPSGFGTLGYGLPAAIGGAIARKGQPTI
ncbi:thiamine pyrophosphate-binding protein, partial [Litoreibacter sp.]|nr:thiamine pyrophosphate-binding protein [Litoreibacter sp.]